MGLKLKDSEPKYDYQLHSQASFAKIHIQRSQSDGHRTKIKDLENDKEIRYLCQQETLSDWHHIKVRLSDSPFFTGLITDLFDH